MLRPAPASNSTASISAGVQLTVSPITASAEWKPDEIALMSRFFSALWIEVRNDSPSTASIDPAGAVIFDQSGTPWLTLDGTQRVLALRWQPWSWHSWLARWWWAGRLEQLLMKMDRLQLQKGAVAAGGARRGLLVFKIIPAPLCRQSELDWTPTRNETDTSAASVPPRTRSPVRVAIGC